MEKPRAYIGPLDAAALALGIGGSMLYTQEDCWRDMHKPPQREEKRGSSLSRGDQAKRRKRNKNARKARKRNRRK